MELLTDSQALARIAAGEIEALTRAATGATFYGPPLTDAQIGANERVVQISMSTCETAARSEAQHFAAAFVDGRFAGYVIGTLHAPESRELDWLMVHPDFHGTPVSAALMHAVMDWLRRDRPMWLSVIQFNRRAIRFYEKFGFAVDPEARTAHVVPHYIMRRPAS
jgi:GNAT superfamily N-acetyltransferase